MIEENPKKRKRNILEQLNVTVVIPEYILCECCKNKVYNYKLCQSDMIYCSRACYEVLVLSRQNKFLDEKPIKRSVSDEDLSMWEETYMSCDEEE